MRVPVDLSRRHDQPAAVAAAGRTGRCRRAGMEHARPRHLGSANDRPALHLLRRTMPSQLGPRRPPSRAAWLGGARRSATGARLGARVQRAIVEDAWDADRRTLTKQVGGGGLDASLLALPLRRVLDARHPRMAATTAAVAEQLGAGGGLLYRYLPEESPSGSPATRARFCCAASGCGRQPGPAGPRRPGHGAVRQPVRSCRPAGAVARADRAVHRRVPRQLPAGLQSRRHHRQRGQPGKGHHEDGHLTGWATSDIVMGSFVPGQARGRSAQPGHAGLHPMHRDPGSSGWCDLGHDDGEDAVLDGGIQRLRGRRRGQCNRPPK